MRPGCRLVLAAVFLAAAVSKITDLRAFADQVLLHTGLPVRLGLLVSAGLPWLELTCGACLLFNRATLEATAIIAALLVAFLIYAGHHLGEMDCGCFVFSAVVKTEITWLQLTRDGLLLLLCLPVLFPKPRQG